MAASSTSFRKGQSGNPGGRKAGFTAWQERCRKFMEQDGGWEELSGIATNREHEAQLAALKVIAEYGFGKPTQYREVDATVTGALALGDVRKALGVK